jgi:hypothetical protein
MTADRVVPPIISFVAERLLLGARMRYLYFGDLQIQPLHVRNVLCQRWFSILAKDMSLIDIHDNNWKILQICA